MIQQDAGGSAGTWSAVAPLRLRRARVADARLQRAAPAADGRRRQMAAAALLAFGLPQ
jgi:hypothetical protein